MDVDPALREAWHRGANRARALLTAIVAGDHAAQTLLLAEIYNHPAGEQRADMHSTLLTMGTIANAYLTILAAHDVIDSPIDGLSAGFAGIERVYAGDSTRLVATHRPGGGNPIAEPPD